MSAGLVVVIVVIGLVSGCALVSTTTTYPQTKLSSRSSMEIEPDSHQYVLTTGLEGQMLNLTLQRAETCRTTEIPLYHKERHIERRDSSPAMFLTPSTKFYAGLLFTMTGALTYLAANSWGGSQSGDKTPDEYRREGMIFGIAGVSLLAIAGLDAIRLRDSTETIGNVEGPPEVRKELCRHVAAPQTDVEIASTRSTWKMRGKTDALGKARFDLGGLGERDFYEASLSLTSTIEGTSYPIAFSRSETPNLISHLSADPTSQLAKDGTIAYVQHSASKVSRCEQALDYARAQMAVRLRAKERFDAKALQSSAQSACKGDPKEKELLALLEKDLVRGIEEEMAVSSAAALDEFFARNDALAITRLLKHDSAAELMRGYPGVPDMVVQLAYHWVLRMQNGDSSPERRAQLCASRRLVLSFAGRERWNTVRAALIARNERDKNVLFLREMDDETCS